MTRYTTFLASLYIKIKPSIGRAFANLLYEVIEFYNTPPTILPTHTPDFSLADSIEDHATSSTSILGNTCEPPLHW